MVYLKFKMQLTNFHYYYPKNYLYSNPIKGLKGCGVGYRFAFNGKELDNETYGEGNEYDFGERIFNSRLGRWLSLDPLMNKFPYFSPYNYAGNIPTFIVDLEGQENIIYIVLLNDKNTKFTKSDAKKVKELTQVRLKLLTINVVVKIVDPKNFKTELLDKTDAVVVLGKRSAVNKFIKKHNIDPIAIKDHNYWDKGSWWHPGNWEKSSNPGNLIGISTYDDYSKKGEYTYNENYEAEREDLKDEAKKIKGADKIDLASFTILHGLGHNSGLGHTGDNTKSLIMLEGDGIANQKQTLSTLAAKKVNLDYVMSLKIKFKDKVIPKARMKTL